MQFLLRAEQTPAPNNYLIPAPVPASRCPFGLAFKDLKAFSEFEPKRQAIMAQKLGLAASPPPYSVT